MIGRDIKISIFSLHYKIYWVIYEKCKFGSIHGNKSVEKLTHGVAPVSYILKREIIPQYIIFI